MTDAHPPSHQPPLQSASKGTEAALQARIAELEQQLERRTAQLEAANDELAAFSYSVAHDLRAPLRAMDGFSRKLLQRHEADLSADGRRYLDVIQRNARQMGELIDGLLALSRLTRQALHVQAVQPRSIVDQVLHDLTAEWSGRQVDIQVGELAPCRADPALLRRAFANLVSNALKFTRGREVARIEIGGTIEDGETVYFVQDNGIGFDMRYADKLFGVFERLHPTEGFEGVGIGLALAQKAVQRHGGRIWAESVPNGGATFFFSVPASGVHAGP